MPYASFQKLCNASTRMCTEAVMIIPYYFPLKKKEEDKRKKKDSLNMNGNLLSQAQFETY
jgi:hypothetical protein